jgi:hypothetical protein
VPMPRLPALPGWPQDRPRPGPRLRLRPPPSPPTRRLSGARQKSSHSQARVTLPPPLPCLPGWEAFHSGAEVRAFCSRWRPCIRAHRPRGWTCSLASAPGGTRGQTARRGGCCGCGLNAEPATNPRDTAARSFGSIAPSLRIARAMRRFPLPANAVTHPCRLVRAAARARSMLRTPPFLLQGRRRPVSIGWHDRCRSPQC